MTPSHERRKRTIIERAEELVPKRHSALAHNFMLSTDEAYIVGSAVASRNKKVIDDILEEPVKQMDEHYETFSIAELRDEWTGEIQRLTGVEATLQQFLTDKKYQKHLDDLLSGRDGNYLDFRPIAMTKFLETVLYVTAPEGIQTFQPREQRPPRRRAIGATLHHRANYLLTSTANRPLGVRGIREGLLAGDESTLDDFLENLSRVHLSQKVIEHTIEQYESGNAEKLRLKVLAELDGSDEDGFDELVGTHILNWEMLPNELADRPDRTSRIRDVVRGAARTDEQRRAIDKEWHDERIDLLFEIAHIGSGQGRGAELYISSAFTSGKGLYIATSLSHPLDPSKRIVVADNPIGGNALYMVDELLTESDSDGRQFAWREVLGSHKHIARSRGARRRYHTGNWSELAKAVCEYGGDYQLAERKRLEAAEKANAAYLADPNIDAYEALQAALTRARHLLDN